MLFRIHEEIFWDELVFILKYQKKLRNHFLFDGINPFLKNSQRHELCFITEHEIYPILASWASTAYITTNFFSKYYLFQKVQNHVCYSCPVGSLCSLSGSESRDCWLRAQMCVFRWMAQMSPVIVITSRVQISSRKLFLKIR